MTPNEKLQLQEVLNDIEFQLKELNQTRTHLWSIIHKKKKGTP